MRNLLLIVILLEVLLSIDVAAQPEVRVVRDIQYDYTDSLQKLDLYLPQNVANFPLIVAIHGGGLMEWDKQQSAHVGYRFASAGIGTAVINYRLSPKVMHPAHTEDAATAFVWVKRHISQYGGNSNAIFIIGHSAGAYLAALLAFDERYLSKHSLTLESIRGVVPVSAFLYVERVAPDRPKEVWGIDSTKWPAASPATYIKSEGPPILLLYADGDEPWRKDQNREMAAALKQIGHRDIDIKEISGRSHRSIWNNIADNDDVSSLIVQFISRKTAVRKQE